MEKGQKDTLSSVCFVVFLVALLAPKQVFFDLNNEPRSLFRRRGTVNLWLREYADGARDILLNLARPGEHERYFIPEQK